MVEDTRWLVNYNWAMVQTRCRWPILGNEPFGYESRHNAFPIFHLIFNCIDFRNNYFNEACTFLPYSRALARISFSWRVIRLWSRITTRPPTMTVSTSLAFSA